MAMCEIYICVLFFIIIGGCSKNSSAPGTTVSQKIIETIKDSSDTKEIKIKISLDTLKLTFAKGDTLTSVSTSFKLEESSNKIDIQWKSSNTSVLKIVGFKAEVIQPIKKTDVLLTATIHDTKIDIKKDFKLTILPSDLKIVEADTSDIKTSSIDFAKGDSLSEVTKNFTLPTEGFNGSNISWESDNKSILSIINGVASITRDYYDVTVTLTATIQSGIKKETKSFKVIVAADHGAAAIFDKSNLKLTFATNESSDFIKTSFNLPSSGSKNSKITWSSSNTSALNPSHGTATVVQLALDTEITLTATITHGTIVLTKNFTLTIKAHPLPPPPPLKKKISIL